MPLDLKVPVGGLYIAEVWGRLYGQETRTRFAYQNIYTEELSILTVATPAFVADHLTSLLTVCSEEWDIWNIRGEAYSPEPNPAALGFRDSPIDMDGDVAGLACPPSVAMVFRRRVGTIGRANRGRVFIPGVPSSGVTAGQVAGTLLTDCLTVCTALGLPVVPEGEVYEILQPVLVKRQENGVVQSWQDIAYWDFDPILRSQRRREINVGM